MPVNATTETPKQAMIVFFMILRVWLNAEHEVCQRRALFDPVFLK
jgi:hypothetical protein